MKFSREDLEAICFGDHDANIYYIADEGEWNDDGKYSFKVMVFKYKDGFYRVGFSRSGSYFTEYEYDFEYLDTECPEVEQKEVIIKNWVIKK